MSRLPLGPGPSVCAENSSGQTDNNNAEFVRSIFYRDLIRRRIGLEPSGCYLAVERSKPYAGDACVVLVVTEITHETSTYQKEVLACKELTWDRQALQSLGLQV